MADQGFWNGIQNQVQNGVSDFLQNEIDRYTQPKKEEQPEATKSVLDSSQAFMQSNMKWIMIFGFVVVALLLLTGGRRGK